MANGTDTANVFCLRPSLTKRNPPQKVREMTHMIDPYKFLLLIRNVTFYFLGFMQCLSFMQSNLFTKKRSSFFQTLLGEAENPENVISIGYL